MVGTRRWLMVAASMWIQCTAGSSYTFGLYSEALKQSLRLDQKQLDSIGFLKDLGANVGAHAGLIYSVVPPWITIAIGAAHEFVGYFMIWLSCTGALALNLWQVCLFMFIAANAQVYLNTGVIVTCVKSFPDNRGTVIGLAKGLLGLSGAILAFIFSMVSSSENQLSFILFISLFPTVTSFLLMFLVRPFPSESGSRRTYERTRFYELSAVSLLLAVCLMCYNLIKSLGGMGKALTFIFRILVLVILASPVAVALRPEPQAESTSDETSKLVLSTDRTETSEVHREDIREDYTLGQAFSSLDFWLLFIAAACGMGSGLTAIDNLSQLGLSLGYSHRDISALVSLLSICNFLGRFVSGLVSDLFLGSSGTPRPVFTVITLAMMAVGNLVIASALPGALYVGIIIIGFCYGSQWSLMPATTSDVFGITHFGTLFNTISSASPLGSYILSVSIAGWIYDKEAEKQAGSHSGATSCIGPQCFRLTFLIVAGVCFFGSLSTLVLVVRTRGYYLRVHRLGKNKV